jgi:hypothetical protein
MLQITTAVWYIWYPIANYGTPYKYRATYPRVRELISLKYKYYARQEWQILTYFTQKEASIRRGTSLETSTDRPGASLNYSSLSSYSKH